MTLPIAVVAAVSLLGFNYQLHSRETAVLDDNARLGAPGQFVKLPGGVTHYDLAGPEGARTVVLVHGFSEPYYLWDGTFEMFVKAGYRVLRYDLFGRGLSDRPDVAYDGNLFDAQLAGLLDALAVRGKVDIAGASMGGPIAATFSCRHPERVRSLTLLDPAYSEGRKLPWSLRMPVVSDYIYDTQISPDLPESQLGDFVHPEHFPGWADKFRPQMRFKGFRHALLSSLQNYLTTDRSKDYACAGRLKTPAFIVWGRADKDVPFALSMKVRALIPQADFLAVDDAAHVPFLEHPEVVDPAWLQFLTTVRN